MVLLLLKPSKSNLLQMFVVSLYTIYKKGNNCCLTENEEMF